jgi:hypothetical protein
MSTPWTIEVPVHFQRCGRGSRKEVHPGVQAEPVPPGRVPPFLRNPEQFPDPERLQDGDAGRGQADGKDP